ncbi:uncharacterized protein LOC123271280 [Cotesia glomerata]|uniref:uncharacterized protein LOC123271280 n=1 Tax=Cotesia glomerata TaxID=32391 RepID=UPI001D01485F|nr:uncharacterized protein LOC123271280 [Cotesia glomerata]XP_044593498.1 uncharacterized protein LOC123271280 [Cotesia glomerata]XP_044593500.1 uncharacterized protein LOC123271280 [Cotesia glomerata]XP_044593501.1 uncharacterized protein LOC123271280 [Cotesia glomerata]
MQERLIIVLLNRNHAFGVSWAFMPDRSEVSFNAALDIACSQIAPLMNPTKIYYDYEQRLNDSLRANIPGATLKRTFLAYANVMIHRATLLNVDLADVNNQIIFKKLLAVALLPAASIVTGFLWLRSNIPGELIPIFEDLFVYYQDNLINLLGPENLSFYNDVDSFSDSMKNHIFNLNTLFNNNNSVWNCLRIFVNQSIRSYYDFHALDINARVSCTPRSRPLLSLKKLRRVWKLFDRNQMEYQTFFASTSEILTEFTNDLLHNGVEHAHDFRLFQDRNVQINIDADNVNHQPHFVGPLVFAEETIDDVRAVNRRAQRVNLAGQPQVVAIQVFDAQDNLCIFCVDRPISRCFSPCEHQVACLECTENWRATAVADRIDFTCPICRTVIREVSIIPAAAA